MNQSDKLIKQLEANMLLDEYVEELGEIIFDYAQLVIQDEDRHGNELNEADHLMTLRLLKEALQDQIKERRNKAA